MKRKVIAITGKIGSGKSVVAKILRDSGFKTVDCDCLARQVAQNPHVVAQVEQLLGSNSVTDGQLNRAFIRERVFGDENLLQGYQQIFFDGVKALLMKELASLKKEKAVFVEIPVLDAFEFPWDMVWRVESSEKNCILRVTARDGVSADNVVATINRQKTYDCNVVIQNNGDMEQLKRSVHIILDENHLT